MPWKNELTAHCGGTIIEEKACEKQRHTAYTRINPRYHGQGDPQTLENRSNAAQASGSGTGIHDQPHHQRLSKQLPSHPAKGHGAAHCFPRPVDACAALQRSPGHAREPLEKHTPNANKHAGQAFSVEGLQVAPWRHPVPAMTAVARLATPCGWRGVLQPELPLRQGKELFNTLVVLRSAHSRCRISFGIMSPVTRGAGRKTPLQCGIRGALRHDARMWPKRAPLS